jgi:hypothetical protein
MLDAMDIAGAAAPVAPWIAVGVLLAAAVLLLAGLATALAVRRRAARPEQPASAPDPVDDDLPGFLDSPPGTVATTPSAHAGHVALMAPAPAPAEATPTRVPTSVLATIAGLTALLVVAAAIVALTGGDGSPDRDGDRAASPQAAEVRMSFAGLVLQQRAVGATVTYPELELTADDDGPVARLTLPTWNCLAAEVPDDPAAAGCTPSITEYAELRPPALELSEDADGLRLVGDFPATTRPTGGTPEPTGLVYPVEITMTADDEQRPGLRSSASGVFSLEDREAESVEGELTPAG